MPLITVLSAWGASHLLSTESCPVSFCAQQLISFWFEEPRRLKVLKLGAREEVTYIVLEVTGCRMTWGAWVGVSGTGTTSERQKTDIQRSNMEPMTLTRPRGTAASNPSPCYGFQCWPVSFPPASPTETDQHSRDAAHASSLPEHPLPIPESSSLLTPLWIKETTQFTPQSCSGPLTC